MYRQIDDNIAKRIQEQKIMKNVDISNTNKFIEFAIFNAIIYVHFYSMKKQAD